VIKSEIRVARTHQIALFVDIQNRRVREDNAWFPFEYVDAYLDESGLAHVVMRHPFEVRAVRLIDDKVVVGRGTEIL
jgi:hypothetical protein